MGSSYTKSHRPISHGKAYLKTSWKDAVNARANAAAFDAWLAEAVALDAPSRGEALAAWESAPGARYCHPREEHLIPLMVCAGAAGDDRGEVAFGDDVMGVRVSAHRFG